MQEERDGAEGRARPPFLLLPDYIIPPLNPISRLLQNCRRKCLTAPYDMRLPMFCRSITLVYLVVFALARKSMCMRCCIIYCALKDNCSTVRMY